jgi:hypothetical protein
MAHAGFSNPFRPGAGHMPPYMAGREHELEEFRRLLKQDIILENLVLTGLRGVGKTVLLETFKPHAIGSGWFWVGADLSESTSLTEESKDKELLPKPFSPSHVNQMLADLGEAGLIYKNRYGKYSFAMPLLGQYIKRQIEQSKTSPYGD